MKDKHYNLTEKPNHGQQDKMPDWMEKVFEKKETVKEDFSSLTTLPKPTAKKCRSCGIILKNNEVGYCSNCI